MSKKKLTQAAGDLAGPAPAEGPAPASLASEPSPRPSDHPSDQQLNALETEPASLEPPGADVTPQPEAARATQPEPGPMPSTEEHAIVAPGSTSGVGEAAPDVTVLPDEVPGETAIRIPVAAAVTPAPTPRGAQAFEDTVTLLEISPADGGGITETSLPGNRAGSPPPPLPARRIGWNQPVARRVAYVLVVLALLFGFLWLLVDLFHVG